MKITDEALSAVALGVRSVRSPSGLRLVHQVRYELVGNNLVSISETG